MHVDLRRRAGARPQQQCATAKPIHSIQRRLSDAHSAIRHHRHFPCRYDGASRAGFG
jgi:hypothetical protein